MSASSARRLPASWVRITVGCFLRGSGRGSGRGGSRGAQVLDRRGPAWPRSTGELVAAADVLDLARVGPSRRPGNEDVRDAAPLGVADLAGRTSGRTPPPRTGRRVRAAARRARRSSCGRPRRRPPPARRSGRPGRRSRTPRLSRGTRVRLTPKRDADPGVGRAAVAGQRVVPTAGADRAEPLVAVQPGLEDGAGVVVQTAGDAQVGDDPDPVARPAARTPRARPRARRAPPRGARGSRRGRAPGRRTRRPSELIRARARHASACSRGQARLADAAARAPRPRGAGRACRRCASPPGGPGRRGRRRSPG